MSFILQVVGTCIPEIPYLYMSYSSELKIASLPDPVRSDGRWLPLTHMSKAGIGVHRTCVKFQFYAKYHTR